MSTKIKLLRKLEYHLNDTATKRVFISLTRSTIRYSYFKNLNSTKTQKEKLN